MSEFAIEVEGGSSVRLPTAGKYCDRDIVVTAKGGGEEVYRKGTWYYMRNMILPDVAGVQAYTFQGCVNMEYLEMPDLTGNITGTCDGCTSLKKAIFPKVSALGHYVFRGCTALEYVQLGSVGNSITSAMPTAFNGVTQSTITVEIFVDAETLAGVTITGIPQNATVIYRNSSTGEVITE